MSEVKPLRVGHPADRQNPIERAVLRRFRELNPSGVIRSLFPVGSFLRLAGEVFVGLLVLMLGLTRSVQWIGSSGTVSASVIMVILGLVFLWMARARRNRFD